MTSLKTSEPALTDDLGFLLARARSISSHAANRRLDRLGLKVRSFSVLSLACDDSRLTQRETAAFLRLDPSQIVSIIDELESRGLVKRVASTDDRRRKQLRATAAGQQLFTEAKEAAAQADEKVFAQLTSAQQEQLLHLLKQIAFHD